MRPASHRRHGFTLLEMMMVVAIIGVLSALAITSMVTAVRNGRSNGAAAVLQQALADARVRALSQHCPHFVQINGFAYSPNTPVPGAPTERGSLSVVRKGTCVGTTPAFEAGRTPELSDRVLWSTTLGESGAAHNGVYLLLSGVDGVAAHTSLETEALTVEYQANGQRLLARDSGNGTFTLDGATTTFSVLLGSTADDTTGPVVQVGATGMAVRQ